MIKNNDLGFISIAHINQRDLPSDELATTLFELSTFKYESGFSYVVSLSYLKSYIEDVEADIKNGMKSPLHYQDLLQIVEYLTSNSFPALFVCAESEESEFLCEVEYPYV